MRLTMRKHVIGVARGIDQDHVGGRGPGADDGT
jgi:hypothetical protein